MKKKSFFTGLLTGVLIMAILIVFPFIWNTFSKNKIALFYKIYNIYNVLDENYIDDYDLEKTENYMLNGLLFGTGDKYSGYIDSSEVKEYMADIEGVSKGAIGVMVRLSDEGDGVYVTKVFEDLSADKAGVKRGDVIREIENADVSEMTIDEITDLIKGDIGTTVNITIYRKSDDSTFSLDVERQDALAGSLFGKMIDDNIGYIEILRFDGKTDEAFVKEYEKLEASGMKKLIIDLRGNGGGLLDSTVSIADYIMPEGIITYTLDKNGEREDYKSGKDEVNIPIVLLVDGDSASASEVLAGALRDSGKAVLVGDTTFGKGIVQSHFNLADGSKIKITVSKYYTPNGTTIHETGLKPDYEIIQPNYWEADSDLQLKKAIEVISEMN